MNVQVNDVTSSYQQLQVFPNAEDSSGVETGSLIELVKSIDTKAIGTSSKVETNFLFIVVHSLIRP